MFRPFILYVASRYIRARCHRYRYFVSFISMVSVLGIGLGVAILITVLSVMNGFEREIRGHIIPLMRQVVVQHPQGIASWPKLIGQIKQHTHVRAVAPLVEGQSLLQAQGEVAPSFVQGILPQKQQQVMALKQYMEQGSLSSLKAGAFNIILGYQLAAQLGVDRGDQIIVLTPKIKITPIGVIPRLKHFRVSGIFHIADASGLDASLAFIHLKDAQALLSMGNNITSLQLKLDDIDQAPQVRQDLYQYLGGDYFISDWRAQYGTYFDAIAMEKRMLFLILLLIVAVAAFNLVSSLVMVVRDKQADIAILRTLGATPAMVMYIFLLQGAMLAGLGTLLGVGLGLLLSHYASAIVSVLQHWLHRSLVPASIYYIDYLPTHIDYHEVANIALLAFALGLSATLYPAWKASRVQPVEALRDA